MRIVCVVLFAGLVLVFNNGCSKKPPPAEAEEAPEEEATVFEYSDTEEIVSAEEVEVKQKGVTEDVKAKAGSLSVKADFNLDGENDIALVEKGADGQTMVSLYIQKEAEEKDKKIYFKGGSISAPVDGTIIGIMSLRSSKYTDLLLLVTTPVGSNEMIHYRNTGKAFEKQVEGQGESGIQASPEK